MLLNLSGRDSTPQIVSQNIIVRHDVMIGTGEHVRLAMGIC